MEENEQSRIIFVPCLRWVRKGVAKCNPEKIQLSKDELVRLINETRSNLRITDDDDETPQPQSATMNVDDEYNFERYDEDDDSTSQLCGIGALAELPTEAEENFSESDDSEKEDDAIKPDDNLVLVGKVEGDAAVFEVFVYNESEESFYPHHDIFLPSIPLCMEWLDHEPGQSAGNYCAIGSMTPVIDVWDLDVVNCLEPAFRLGRKPSRKKGLQRVGHTDAVLDLSWNHNYHHIIASGSVDKTAMLWDIDRGEPATTLKAFTDKVQCVEWHKLEAYTLLAGSCDSTARVFDCRTEEHQKWDLTGEAERLSWNPLEPYSFYAATSSGNLQYFDCRKGQMWSVDAHEKEVTGLAVSDKCPGLVVTGSGDGTVKIWDCNETGPSMVHEADFSAGVIHSLELCPDLPFVLAVGGDNKSNHFLVYDLRNIDVVKHRFESRQLVQLTPSNSSGVSLGNAS